MVIGALQNLENLHFGFRPEKQQRIWNYVNDGSVTDPVATRIKDWGWRARNLVWGTKKNDINHYSSAALEGLLKSYNSSSPSTDKPLITIEPAPEGASGFYHFKRLNLQGNYEDVTDTFGNKILCDKRGRLIEQDTGSGAYVVNDGNGKYYKPDTDTPALLSGKKIKPFLLSSRGQAFAPKGNNTDLKIDCYQFISGTQINNQIGQTIEDTRKENKKQKDIINQIKWGAAQKTLSGFAGGAVVGGSMIAVSMATATAASLAIPLFITGAVVLISAPCIAYLRGRDERLQKIDQAKGKMIHIDKNYATGIEQALAQSVGGKLYNPADLTSAKASQPQIALIKEQLRGSLGEGASSFADDVPYQNAIAARALQIHNSSGERYTGKDDNTENSGSDALMNYAAQQIAQAIEWNKTRTDGKINITDDITLKSVLDEYAAATNAFKRDSYNKHIHSMLENFGRTR